MGIFKSARAKVTSPSPSWKTIGADEYLATVDYETPPGGEWVFSYAEPFDLDPGVKNLAELDCLDAASARLRADAAANIVCASVVSLEALGRTRAERIQRNAALVLASIRQTEVV